VLSEALPQPITFYAIISWCALGLVYPKAIVMTGSHTSPTAARLLQGRVLVADASKTTALAAAAVLLETGLSVDYAENANDARSRALTGRYDALLVDAALFLPTGESLIEVIGENIGHCVPIIAMVGRQFKGDHALLPEAVVAKPVNANALREVVAAVLPGRPGTRPLVDEAMLSEHWPAELADVLQQVVAIFLGEAEERCTAIEAAVSTDDRRRLIQEAHGLKGAAANVCAARLSANAAALEMSGQDATPASLAQAARELREVHRDTIAALRAILHLDG
jgi:two-component system, sensor histidine kinase and response regulator